MIAGADTSTVNRLASHLTDCGHKPEVTETGLECVAALRESVPDLLILDICILWGGGAGVMAVMDGDPKLAEIPVVLFATGNQPLDFRKHPRIVASLTRPAQPQDLSSLNCLLIKIASICGVARFSARRIDHSVRNHESRLAQDGSSGSIRQAAFKEPSIFPSIR